MEKIILKDGEVMFRVKNFYMKKVFDYKGKKLGVVEDLYIDFYNSSVLALKLSKKIFLNKKNSIKVQNIISIEDDILVKEKDTCNGLLLSDILGLDIINLHGNIIGVIEDIIISKENFELKGIVVSTGILDRLIHGKDILVPKECVLGENCLIHKNDSNISLRALPKRLQ